MKKLNQQLSAEVYILLLLTLITSHKMLHSRSDLRYKWWWDIYRYEFNLNSYLFDVRHKPSPTRGLITLELTILKHISRLKDQKSLPTSCQHMVDKGKSRTEYQIDTRYVATRIQYAAKFQLRTQQSKLNTNRVYFRHLLTFPSSAIFAIRDHKYLMEYFRLQLNLFLLTLRGGAAFVKRRLDLHIFA